MRELLPSVLRDLFAEIRFELFLDDGRGALAPVLDAGEPRPDGGRALLERLRSRVALTRQALAKSHAYAAGRNRRSGSIMSSPLLDGAGRLLGILVVERAPELPNLTRMELVALEGIAAQLSIAIQRLAAQRADAAHERIALDRKSASKLQRNLMSRSLPPDVGITTVSEYLPAFDVGGDFFGLEYLGDGRIGAAIGDVSGNGVSAALVMSRVASDVERALRAGESPAQVLRSANEGLTHLDSERFVSACAIHLDTRTRTLLVANAGHLPLVVRRADGQTFTCGDASGMPLGTVACEYAEEEFALQPRDILLLMTDGLLDALDPPSGRMGLKHLVRLVQHAPHDAALIHERIRSAVGEARASHVIDDVAWVGLQLAG